jgi:O-methyltransferase
MAGSLKDRAVSYMRRRIRAVFPPEPNYTGPHGCLKVGAAFITWNQVPGDYLEFGVAGGESFVAAWKAISSERARHLAMGFDSPEYRAWKARPPRMFAFDSFEGLPDVPATRQVDYAPGAYGHSEEEFRSNLRRAALPDEMVFTVRGYYDRSLTPEVKARHGLTQAAMVMVDCDLYESTVPVLDFITDLVGQGTVIVFHDWFRFKGSPKEGEQRACAEWLARNPHLELIELWREAPQAVSFLVNIR